MDAYFEKAVQIMAKIDCAPVERITEDLAAVRDSDGWLFVLVVGGGAENAGHAVLYYSYRSLPQRLGCTYCEN